MRLKIFLYVGSKCPYCNPAVGMRCLYGPTQYNIDTWYLPHYGTLEYIHIRLQQKKSKQPFLTLKNILLLPLNLDGSFGELPLK